MHCPRCRHPNGAAANFCEACGAALGRACPACREQTSAQARFCPACGASLPGPTARPEPAERAPRDYTPKHLADRILQSRSALEGERKHVTVFFADVKGSMELADALDPEDWHRILERFFDILTEGVHRFEGTVNQYTGDGIMALFGAPIAHEDHAQRACYAALQASDEIRRYAEELRRTRGLSFSTRIGLHSGEVVVGKIGDDLRMDYTAQGRTVGLAARIQEIAAPDRVYVTDDTASRVKGYFQLRDLDEFELRGVKGRIRVHELQGVGALRTRLEVSRARGFSRFVGRAEEMQMLESALERAEKGSPQLVGVVGEAGVGKSRLCFEFLERCRARGIMTSEAQGVAHGKNVPLLPILRLFRTFYGITERDSDVTAREKIAGRLLLLGERFRELLPVIFDFMGVPDPEHPAPVLDPEARQRQITSVMKGVSQARAGRETAVALLEDLHWFDSASEALLEPLVDAPPGSRSLIVLNFRPEYRAAWMQSPRYQQVPLLPLAADAIDDLLRDLLGDDPSLAGLSERLRERTGGNPFFTEEAVRSLAEAGNLEGSRGAYRLAIPVDAIAVPDTVQAVLAARIDRLAEREKQVLQTAAVVGKTFAEPVLERALELPKHELSSALRALQSAEFVYEQALYPVAEYAFKHPLTQQVALESQLVDRRRRVHAAVARATEAVHADRLDEHAALLAHHWEEAGEALAAARWHARAALRAGATHAAESVRHWRRVRALLEQTEESEETLALGLSARSRILGFGWRIGIAESEADALFSEGKDLARRAGSTRLSAELLSAYTAVGANSGDVGTYRRYALEAAREADRAADVQLRVQTRVNLAYSHYLSGDLEKSLGFCSEAFRLAPSRRVGRSYADFDPALFLTYFSGHLLALMGRPDEAESVLRLAARLAGEAGEPDVALWSTVEFASLAEFRGDADEALAQARRALDLAENTGSLTNHVTTRSSLCLAQLANAQWVGAIESGRESLEILRTIRTAQWLEPRLLAQLAEAHLGAGDLLHARAHAEEALHVAGAKGARLFEIEGRLALARVLLAAEGADAGEAIRDHLAVALERIESCGGRAFEPRVHQELGRLARALGDEPGARRELGLAQRLFLAMGAKAHADRLAAELAP
jgi:adenylate cyclase